MKITFQTDKLKAIIEKLNHVATGNPGDLDFVHGKKPMGESRSRRVTEYVIVADERKRK